LKTPGKIKGFENCKEWLKGKSQQYKMKTEIVDITTDENGTTKVSVLVSGDFAIGDYPLNPAYSP
jgi:hypothetical protein